MGFFRKPPLPPEKPDQSGQKGKVTSFQQERDKRRQPVEVSDPGWKIDRERFGWASNEAMIVDLLNDLHRGTRRADAMFILAVDDSGPTCAFTAYRRGMSIEEVAILVQDYVKDAER